MGMDHYETLGIPRGAEPEDIKRAYRSKASRAHPDRAGGSSKAFHAVRTAYEVLSDAERRAHYDNTGQDETPPTQPAEEMAAQIFDQLLKQANFSGDYIKAGREIATVGLRQLDKERVVTKQEINRLTKLLGRVLCNGAANVFEDLLDQRMKSARAKLQNLDANLVALNSAIELLRGYTDTAPPAPPPPREHGWRIELGKLSDWTQP